MKHLEAEETPWEFTWKDKKQKKNLDLSNCPRPASKMTKTASAFQQFFTTQIFVW